VTSGDLKDIRNGKITLAEWIALSREGRVMYDEDSRREVFERVLAFLDKHLMSGTSPAS